MKIVCLSYIQKSDFLNMVKQSTWIVITIVAFFVGLGIGFLIFSYISGSFIMTRQQMMTQMISNPETMNEWMNKMMANPQAMQKMHYMMMKNPEHMNQMMGQMMMDPISVKQMHQMMFRDPQHMHQMMGMMNMTSHGNLPKPIIEQ